MPSPHYSIDWNAARQYVTVGEVEVNMSDYFSAFSRQMAQATERMLAMSVPAPDLAFVPKTLKCVAVSDTLGRRFPIPDGDVFIHAGNFTVTGTKREFKEFNSWLKALPHKHKLVVPGSNDYLAQSDPRQARELLTEAKLLLDATVVIEGRRFHGTPYARARGDSAFGMSKEEAKDYWRSFAAAHKNLDVLITNCPPGGILDGNEFGRATGDMEMWYAELDYIRPKYHAFGRCLDQGGKRNYGSVNAINCAMLNQKFMATTERVPFVFDLD